MPVARRTRIFLVGTVTLLGAVALLPSGLMAHHQWGKYHWSRAANPLRLDVGVNLGSGWGAYLSTAIADWNLSSVLHLTTVPGDSDPSSCPPTEGQLEVCNFNSGATGWLGIAQKSGRRGGRISSRPRRG